MKRAILATRLLVAVGILVFLFSSFDVGEAMTALAGASVPWLATALLFNVAGIVFSAFRWQRLARHLAPALGLRDAIRFYWTGSFFSTVMPSNIGGDAVRLAIARKSGAIEAIFTSIAVERVTGFLVVMLLGLVGILTFPDAKNIIPAYGLLVLVLAGTLVVVPPLLLFGAAPLARIGAGRGGLQGRIAGKLGGIGRSMLAYRRAPRVLLWTFLHSLVFYAIMFVVHVSCIRAVGGEIGLAGVLVAAPVVALVSALPLSVNGIGVSEGAFVLFYARVGVDPQTALAAALLRRILITLGAAFGGLFWMRQKNGTREPGD